MAQEHEDVRTPLWVAHAAANKLPKSRNASLVITKIEEALLWLDTIEFPLQRQCGCGKPADPHRGTCDACQLDNLR